MPPVTESYTAVIHKSHLTRIGTHEVSIESPDPLNLPWEQDTVCICIYVYKEIEIDGEVFFSAEPKQLGPSYYHPDSKLLSHEDARKSVDRATLLWNIEVNGWSHVIESPNGFVSPYIAGKTVILQR
jgi:hypothetical protein